MRCAACGRRVDQPEERLSGRFAICRRCVGRTVTVRTAGAEGLLGARTFYVSSFTRAGLEHTVKLVRRTLRCTCEDYTHRAQVLRDLCLHCRVVRLLGRAAGGVRALPFGATLTFRLDDPAAVRQRRRRA